MSASHSDPEKLVRHVCRDSTLRQVLLDALHTPGVTARVLGGNSNQMLIHGPGGSVTVSMNSKGGDPNQVKRTRGQLRRIGLPL